MDPSPAGAQPMANEDGQVLVVFNGEIYNHRELRSWLEGRGHSFRSEADTEVLVHLYEEHGAALVEELRGMFAFAIYDLRSNSLLLARDRFGIKPLYVVTRSDQVLFASELKALRAASGFTPAIDRQAVFDFLSLSYIPEPATGYQGVTALEPGTTLQVSASGLRRRKFARVTPHPVHATTLEGATERAERELVRAVSEQSVADVPVAALLSGGIDSSLVVAACDRASRAPPTTFNVRFPDPRYDETEAACAVARHCRTSHRTIDLDAEALSWDGLVTLLRHFDQPFADSSLLPTYHVCRALREAGFKCSLSGDGGDEVFGGYPSFWRLRWLHALALLPDATLRVLEHAGRRASRWTTNRGRQVARAARAARAVRHGSGSLFADLGSYLSEAQKERVLLPGASDGLLPLEHRFSSWGCARDLEDRSRMLTEAYFAVILPSDMLKKVDMMSMRAGVEVRVPMLAEPVVALGLSLPHALKAPGRPGKRVLRQLAARWLPPSIASKPKQGFQIPLDAMVGDTFQTRLEEVLLDGEARTRSFIDGDRVRDWLGAFGRARRGERGKEISREGLQQRLLILLSLELWMKGNSLSWS